MKVLSIFFFSGGVVFLILTFTLMMRGDPLLVHVGRKFVTVLPRYPLLTAAALLIAGCVSAFTPHP